MSTYLVWRRDYSMQADLSPLDTAMIQRGMGFVMTEQKRYPDAEAAYQTALKLDPKDKTAREELKRIAKLRSAK
jgi:tetratricopeptide (TPR) repeat protein